MSVFTFCTILLNCKEIQKKEGESISDIQAKSQIDSLTTQKEIVPLQKKNKGNFEKWKGKYFLSIIEAQGEGPYNAAIELEINQEGEAHLYNYYQELNDTVKSGGMKIYGHFTTIDDNTIEFGPEVIYQGEDNYINKDFTLHYKKGNYFIKTEMLVPETIEDDLIPIRKIK